MSAVQDLIEYVKKQIGVSEDPLGSNIQKYGAMLDTIPWYLYKEGDREWIHQVNGHDWCTQMVDASFITVFGIDKARRMLFRPTYNNLGAVVKYAFNYFKGAGRGYTKAQHDPQPGDVIYFQNSEGLSHTGVVISVTSSTVTTVEGNAGTNDCYVVKRTYNKTYDKIYGYGVPDYEEDPDPKELDGFKVGNTYQVICDEPLSIRKGPGTSYDYTGEMKKGDKIVCKALRHDGEMNTWLQHEKGWSCGLYHGERYLDDPVKDGWIKEGGKWYYYEDGKMIKSKWEIYKGQWYYLGADGAMVTGWKSIEKLDYYFYPDGHCAQDEWMDGWFLDMEGQKNGRKGSWKKDDKGSWWQDTAGWYPRDRWIRIDGKNIQFNSAGYAVNK